MVKLMPNVGDTQEKYGRTYVWINPDASLGPGTWRLSSVEQDNGHNGGGGVANIETTAPITHADGVNETTVGFDITILPNHDGTGGASASSQEFNVVV